MCLSDGSGGRAAYRNAFGLKGEGSEVRGEGLEGSSNLSPLTSDLSINRGDIL